MNPPVPSPPPPPPQRPSGPPKPPARPKPLARAEAIFHSALNRPPEERAACVAEACGDDASLLADVRALLAAHEGAGAFMEETHPMTPEIEAELARLKPEEEGERIGRYKLQKYARRHKAALRVAAAIAAVLVAAMTALAAGYGADGSASKAIKLAEEALALARRILPAGDPRTVEAMKMLIPLYKSVDLAGDAAKLEAEIAALKGGK